MALKHKYASEDDIPEEFRTLYSEKNGSWEVTGISGLKTQADVDRIQNGLVKERAEHKATKSKLDAWGDRKPADTFKQLDRISELEAAAGGKLDDAKIEELTQKRVDAVIASRLSPVERELKATKDERDSYKNEVEGYKVKDRKRSLRDALRPHLLTKKVLPEHHEDAEMWAERQFEQLEDGQFVTKDKVSVEAGLSPKDWLDVMLEKKPAWVPGSVGGGAGGSGHRGGLSTSNPWSHDGWNMTEQGKFHRTHGAVKAAAAAKRAGTTLGGPRPAKK